MRRRIFLEALIGDLKFTVRSLRKNPGFTLVAVIVMALGIGANTAVFSVVNAVLLKPLAYRDPDRLVSLASVPKRGEAGSRSLVSVPNFHDWHDQSTAFEGMAYYGSQRPSVMVGNEAQIAQVTFVTPEFFRVFGVNPILGRHFAPDEEKRGDAAAVVVSHAFWHNHFGENARVLDQTIKMFGKVLPIIGVMPVGFDFPAYSTTHKTDLWILANTLFREGNQRSANIHLVVARLKANVTLEQAQAQMTSIADRLERQYPASNRDRSVVVTRLRDQMVGPIKLTLYMLMGGVAVVWLIACANMANLLLAKATARVREIAIRAALGAGRGRIFQQLFTESVLLALFSGMAGLIFAVWGVHALVALAPSNVPRLGEIGVDPYVLAFTFVVSIVAGVLFGFAPAFAGSRVDLNRALKQSGTQSTGGSRAAGRIRRALVVMEIAFSVVLLAGAGLLIKSFVALSNVPLGFRPENLLVMDINIPGSSFEDQRRATRFDKVLLAEIAAIPGVSAVGSMRLPPGKPFLVGDYWIDNLPAAGGLAVSVPQAVYSPVSPGTFAALGIPVTRGRDFNDSDAYEAPFTVVINEVFARKSFPGQDPIGRVIFGVFVPRKPMKIVGIVGDVRQWANLQPLPEIYLPYQQHPYWGMDLSIVARTAEPIRTTQAIRKKVRELAPEVPVSFTTAEASLRENVATPRFRTLLLGIFSGLAVCLAMAGIYGVIAYLVGQRFHEIGLRIALGASAEDVLWLVLREGLVLAGAGLAVGLAGAIVATRLLTSLLFEIQPTDPMTYVAVTVAIGLVSLVASCAPALRAVRIDPLIALRQD